jgi:hypothetical protein
MMRCDTAAVCGPEGDRGRRPHAARSSVRLPRHRLMTMLRSWPQGEEVWGRDGMRNPRVSTLHGPALPFDVFNFDRRPRETYRRRRPVPEGVRHGPDALRCPP